jgi:protein required for attachment to host cells
MKRAVIAVVDAAQARLFEYEEGADPASQLHEIRDLHSAGRKLRIGEQVTSSEPGRASASDGPALSVQGTATHTKGYERSATDDHRGGKEAEMDAKFARDVVQALDEIIAKDHHHHLILAASPKMLGELRRNNGVLHRADLELHEVPKILTTMTVTQLHDQLAAMELIAPRRRLAAAR